MLSALCSLLSLSFEFDFDLAVARLLELFFFFFLPLALPLSLSLPFTASPERGLSEQQKWVPDRSATSKQGV